MILTDISSVGRSDGVLPLAPDDLAWRSTLAPISSCSHL
jgi:hypothetical protein